jgi:hypothetical protein
LHLYADAKPESKGIRKAGGGRKKAIDKEDGLVETILEIISPHTVGDPINTLLWTSKSTRKLSGYSEKESL